MWQENPRKQWQTDLTPLRLTLKTQLFLNKIILKVYNYRQVLVNPFVRLDENKTMHFEILPPSTNSLQVILSLTI